MKKILLLTFLFISVLPSLFANHALGGELYWKCLSNGKYIFYMTFYRDCTGAAFGFRETSIEIFGSPLPKDATGSTLDAILLTPDSSKWKAANEGDTSPECTSLYGSPLGCGRNFNGNGDNGVFQAFYFKSSPITLSGVPPESGWRFYWTSKCCRTGLVNIDSYTGGGTNAVLLRAEMLPTKDKDDLDPCYDSSPEFSGLPAPSICRSFEFTYNSGAVDFDLMDSIDFGWGKPLDAPAGLPTFLTYTAGYSFEKPTPDTAFDSRNIPATIDNLTGLLKLAVYNGRGVRKYLLSQKVESWREGVLISRVYREWPLTVFDCPLLPSGKVNHPPKVLMDGDTSRLKIIEVFAGQKIQIPIEVEDTDSTGRGTELQQLTLVPNGLLFSKTFEDSSNCELVNGAIEPCAILDTTPFLDINSQPRVYKLEGFGKISTEFIWQTTCDHVNSASTIADDRSSTYNFVFRVTDDHCPVPALIHPTLAVKVKDQTAVEEPTLKGISVGLDGKVTYQWVPPFDPAGAFDYYQVETATVVDGGQPNLWINLNSRLTEFQSKQVENQDFGLYGPIGGIPANGPNLLNKRRGLDWFLRMNTVSGCGDTLQSNFAEKIQIMEVDVEAAGSVGDPQRGVVRLHWNRAKPLNSKNEPHFLYESNTKFYVWENDSIEVGGVADSTNWYMRESTTDTATTLNSNVCGTVVGFRIEARDTVVFSKIGHFRNVSPEQFDTLVFSSFSTIDTLFMEKREGLNSPELDTIMVLENGDVQLSVDVKNSSSVGRFELFQDTTSGMAIDTFQRGGRRTSIVIGAGATAGTAETRSIGRIGMVKGYALRGFGQCDPLSFFEGNSYSTISPFGGMTSFCPPIFTLKWNCPRGYSNALLYQVYANGELVDTLSGDTTLIMRVQEDSSYTFQIIALDESKFSNKKLVNISPTLSYTVPAGLRTDEIVEAPALKCVLVQPDGSVNLSFMPGRDSTANWTAYEFSYKEIDSSSWKIFTGSNLVGFSDEMISITGIDASLKEFEFRARSLSGCSGLEPSNYSDTLSTVKTFIYVNNDTLKSKVVADSYQWFDCNTQQNIDGATDSQFLPSDSGKYALIINFDKAVGNEHFCVDTSFCYPYYPVGIEKISFKDQLRFYPNPTTGNITIESNSNTQRLFLQVRNIHGQLIQEKEFVHSKRMEVALQGEKGIYFLQFTNEKGERANWKVVKQ